MLKTNRKVCCILLALVLVLASCTLAFANDNQIQPKNVSICSIDVERISNTSAETAIDAGFTNEVTSATCTATLMEYKDGSLSTATGVSPTVQKKTIDGWASLYMVSKWELKAGKVYKLKVVLKDTIDGVTYTNTYYSNQF